MQGRRTIEEDGGVPGNHDGAKALPLEGDDLVNEIVIAPRLLMAGQREIPAEGVLRLYQTAGWWPERTAEQVRAVLRASPAVGAWQGEDLIGFARAVTDGVPRAYVEDVVVSPDWRGTGVGRALLAGLME